MVYSHADPGGFGRQARALTDPGTHPGLSGAAMNPWERGLPSVPAFPASVFPCSGISSHSNPLKNPNSAPLGRALCSRGPKSTDRGGKRPLVSQKKPCRGAGIIWRDPGPCGCRLGSVPEGKGLEKGGGKTNQKIPWGSRAGGGTGRGKGKARIWNEGFQGPGKAWGERDNH